MWKWIRKFGSALWSLVCAGGILKHSFGLPGYIDDFAAWLSWIGAAWQWGTGMSLNLWVYIVLLLLGLGLFTWEWWWPQVSPKLSRLRRNPLGRKVYTQLSLEEMMGEASDLGVPFDSSEGATFSQTGKWLRVDAPAMFSADVTRDPIELTVGEAFCCQISLKFDNAKWCSRLAAVKDGDRILAEGRIVTAYPLGVTLEDCAFLDGAMTMSL